MGSRTSCPSNEVLALRFQTRPHDNTFYRPTPLRHFPSERLLLTFESVAAHFLTFHDSYSGHWSPSPKFHRFSAVPLSSERHRCAGLREALEFARDEDEAAVVDAVTEADGEPRFVAVTDEGCVVPESQAAEVLPSEGSEAYWHFPTTATQLFSDPGVRSDESSSGSESGSF